MKSNSLLKTVSAGGAIAAMVLLPGCGLDLQSDREAAAAVEPSATAAVVFERADGPIEQLTTLGGHCFETATEADTARRRAADVVASGNAAQRDRLDRTGELVDYGRPHSVTDIRPNAGGGSCYRVVAQTLAARLGEDRPPTGCCAR
ncbi:hypothetical protein H7J87_12125 [Mycolicibacterium wolinskyi]|nr:MULTISPECIES: hypothetical protein [Mycolicibacterium]MCV7286079.1 hypothetical protein [Mycolicibacterium wolinskyi]MCV7296275.1 hypothetical protein [Mycolicibacterium goodii]